MRLAEPPAGVWGRQEAVARAEHSGAGAFRVRPLGGSEVRQGAAAVRARCRADGGPERGLAAQREAGAVQPRSVRLSVAGLTGPPTAAQTGIPSMSRITRFSG